MNNTTISRYPTPETVRYAFASQKKMLADATGFYGDINLSSIATKLIQYVGRFAERFASDFLFTWRNVEQLTSEPCENDDSIILFAIRRDGVDHTNFFMRRILPHINNIFEFVHPEHEYRSILAVRIFTYGEDMDRVAVELKDITDSFGRFRSEDRDKDWSFPIKNKESNSNV